MSRPTIAGLAEMLLAKMRSAPHSFDMLRGKELTPRTLATGYFMTGSGQKLNSAERVELERLITAGWDKPVATTPPAPPKW